MGKYYTGIGSRETPKEILDLMTRLGSALEDKGYILRSGGAGGADLAFEKGVTQNKDIFLPWRGFNGSNSTLYNQLPLAFDLASEHHPAWGNLKDSVKKLMARNSHQVLGKELKVKSSFVLCWTPDGCESSDTRTNKTGGTGLAISLASSLGIPIYNLADEISLNKMLKFLEQSDG